MWENFKNYFFAHFTGLGLILLGWYISVIYSAVDRFSSESAIISTATIVGLILILIGTYLPDIWILIFKKKKARRQSD